MFSDFMTDKVSLVKQDGRRFEDVAACVQPKKIFIDNAKLPIEEGDKLERVLPNGLIETYIVLDRGFHTDFGSMKAHYQVSVRKESAASSRPPVQRVTCNIQGTNPRVNIGSVDQSVNVGSIDASSIFADFRELITEKIDDEAQRTALLQKIGELEVSKGSPTFAERYKEFMALAADHVTVLAPLLPGLAQLLG